MAQQKIYSSKIQGKLQAPASKSVVQRALAAALLCDGTSTLSNFTSCDDAEAAIAIIKALEATVCENGRELKVTSKGAIKHTSALKLYCGESGLSSRLFAPISLLFGNKIELNGEGSLLKRPFTVMESSFAQLGVSCTTFNNFLPLQLEGKIKSGNIKLDGSSGSQFLSGLLMTLPLLQGDSMIEVDNLQSKPYIDLTIEVLKSFGISIEHDNYSIFSIKGGQQYEASDYAIEGDWSGASCLLVAGAVAGSIEINNLNASSSQADKVIVDVLKSVGAAIYQTENSIKVSKNVLLPFEFDARHCPDLFPALAALAANCEGISRIIGINRLVNKESNRALTLQTELNNVGINVEFEGDSMLVHGGQIKGGQIFAHNDHRIAMAMAVTGLTAQNEVVIDGVECVAKSYPTFFKDLKSIQKII